MEDKINLNNEGYNIEVNGKLLFDMLVKMQVNQDAFLMALLSIVSPEVDREKFFQCLKLAGTEAAKNITQELYGTYGESIDLENIIE